MWNCVRKFDTSMLEYLVTNGYVSKLDESIFEYTNDDEIILCLNYDGLYGNVQNFSHIEWLNRLDASLSRVHRKFSC